jgi:hypothetical protein
MEGVIVLSREGWVKAKVEVAGFDRRRQCGGLGATCLGVASTGKVWLPWETLPILCL